MPRQEVGTMSGKVAGIVALALSLASGVVSILYYTSHHTKRGLVLLIGFVLLLVLGILFLVRSGRQG
jgi:ABC-type nickel/cobalt efflux system permease component RcnA